MISEMVGFVNFRHHALALAVAEDLDEDQLARHEHRRREGMPVRHCPRPRLSLQVRPGLRPAARVSQFVEVRVGSPSGADGNLAAR